jgi:hypothetical protein
MGVEHEILPMVIAKHTQRTDALMKMIRRHAQTNDKLSTDSQGTGGDYKPMSSFAHTAGSFFT